LSAILRSLKTCNDTTPRTNANGVHDAAMRHGG
jgi:hypothetical protein